MGIIQYFLICLVIGVVVWLIHAYTPIPKIFKTIILWAGVIVCIVLLASAFGLLGNDIAIPKLK